MVLATEYKAHVSYAYFCLSLVFPWYYWSDNNAEDCNSAHSFGCLNSIAGNGI